MNYKYEFTYEDKDGYAITDSDVERNHHYPHLDRYTSLGYEKRMIQTIAMYLDRANDDGPFGDDIDKTRYSFKVKRTSMNRVVFELIERYWTEDHIEYDPHGDPYIEYVQKDRVLFTVTGQELGHHVVAAVCAEVRELRHLVDGLESSPMYPIERF